MYRAAEIGASLALSAMLSVQIGVVVALNLVAQVGVTGAVWLQMCAAAILLLAMARPRPSMFNRRSLTLCVMLGVVTTGLNMFQLLAVSRIPLGTAMALSFLGPLTLSVVRKTGRTKLWPATAAAGVVLLTRPWSGSVDAVGVGAALLVALCWATYILLTQRVGQVLPGITALAVSVPVAAMTATLVAAPTALPLVTWPAIAVAAAVAVLVPALPYTLELLALRRLDTGTFGTLMSLEPAVALMVGIVLLGQVPGLWELTGVALVVMAGWGATRPARRTSSAVDVTQQYPMDPLTANPPRSRVGVTHRRSHRGDDGRLLCWRSPDGHERNQSSPDDDTHSR